MYRLPKIPAAHGILILALLFVTIFLAACGGDDPVAPVETNGAPNAPAINAGAGAPADAAVDVALGAQLHWTCADPDDDSLTYAVAFGTAASPPVVTQSQGSSNYSPSGLLNGTTYYWRVTANDGEASTSSPVWSFTTVGAATETVSTPNAPAGPVSGATNVNLLYAGSGASSSMGHTLQYRYDWGLSTFGEWTANSERSNRWTLGDTYEVRQQARCADHPTVESAWSAATTVVITAPTETIAPITFNEAPNVGGVNEQVEFVARGGTSLLGHTAQLQFDWGDGTTSDWMYRDNVSYIGSHAWTAVGTYQVTAIARCVEHPTSVSERSLPHSVVITDSESVAPPSLSPDTEVTVPLGYGYSQNVVGGESSTGHDVEYQLDYGNGTMSDWHHGYGMSVPTDVEGDFQIRARARCIAHPDVVSDWSATRLVHIVVVEDISPPSLSGPATGTTGVPVTFTVADAVSTFGHTLEYQLYWGYDYDQGSSNPQGWTTPDNLTITWDAPGNFLFVFVKARCVDHPDVEASGSAYHLITISD